MTDEPVRLETQISNLRLATEKNTVTIESLNDDDSINFQWTLTRADAILLGRALIEEASGD